MAAGTPIDPKHRLPWLVAGCAIMFAVVVLVRSELNPMQSETRADQQAVITVSSPSIVTPPPQVSTPAVPLVDLPPPQPLPVNTPAPPVAVTVTPAIAPAPAPSPTPSPTPQPVYSLEGLVTDVEGLPVENATIKATLESGGSERALNARSDAAGRFRLEKINSDEIDLMMVEAVGFGRNAIENIPLPLPDAIEIVLTPLAGLNVFVETAGGDARTPFDGQAEFVLMQRRSSNENTTQTGGLREALIPEGTFVPVAEQRVTVSDGQFRLEEVEPGEYKAALRSGSQYAESPAVRVSHGSRSITTVTLGLNWPVSGKVVDEQEKGVGAAHVQLARKSPPALYVESGPHVAVSNTDGQFLIEKVPPGSYLATVAATGFTTTTYPLDVPQEGMARETSFTLGRKSPSIRVTVRSADGRPITDARLVLLMTDPTTKTIFAKTDEAGTYLFDRLSPGMYTLSATAPESRTRQKSVEVQVNDGEAHDLEISFPRTVRVLGTARQAGRPYRGLLRFSLRGTIGMETMVKTDEHGGYAVDLEPGEYMVGSPEQPNAQVVVVRSDAQPRTDIEVK